MPDRGHAPVAILSYPFWLRQFGGNPKIVGQSFAVNGQPVIVAGVLPETFRLRFGVLPGERGWDFYLPAVMDFWRTWGNTLSVFGRLKPGVTIAQAEAESRVLWPRLRAGAPPIGMKITPPQ